MPPSEIQHELSGTPNSFYVKSFINGMPKKLYTLNITEKFIFLPHRHLFNTSYIEPFLKDKTKVTSTFVLWTLQHKENLFAEIYQMKGNQILLCFLKEQIIEFLKI